MKLTRRKFLAGCAGTAALAGPTYAAQGFADYAPGMIEDLLGQGKTVFVDYAATWCGTCARQERVITALLAQNPAYAQNVAFVRVDWDTYRKADVTTSCKIPRRSTLLVLKGDKELGRIVAGTGEQGVRALMATALTAATA